MLINKISMFGAALALLLLTGCVSMTPAVIHTDFNTAYLPEFVSATAESDGEAGGIEIPIDGFAAWTAESQALARSKDIKDSDFAMFWVDANEIIMTNMYWPAESFKPSFLNFMIIDIETGAISYPDEDRSIDYTERLEGVVERRDFASTKAAAKTAVLTGLSFLAAVRSRNYSAAKVYKFKEYQGEIRNLTTSNELKYHIKVLNASSEVVFTTADNDKIEHVFQVPKAEMYLSPSRSFVYFPWGQLLNAEKSNDWTWMWRNYSPVISSCLDAGWNRMAMLERNPEGGHLLRVSAFTMPMEED